MWFAHFQNRFLNGYRATTVATYREEAVWLAQHLQLSDNSDAPWTPKADRQRLKAGRLTTRGSF